MRRACLWPEPKAAPNWLSRHVNDPFVKQAQKDGYRSRSAYKLIELNEKDRLIARHADHGPGVGARRLVAGGRQARRREGPGAGHRHPAHGCLIANVDFIQGDFTDDAIVQQIARTGSAAAKFDLIISDIAPNITGIDSADQAESIYFLELALDTVRKTLKPGATFAAKMFQGSGSDEYVKELRTLVREGADPQARGVARGVARGLCGGEGVQGLKRTRFTRWRLTLSLVPHLRVTRRRCETAACLRPTCEARTR